MGVGEVELFKGYKVSLLLDEYILLLYSIVPIVNMAMLNSKFVRRVDGKYSYLKEDRGTRKLCEY
jgi:hypothetical protein